MARTRKNQTPTDATPGFAFKLQEDSELSSAMLIAEDEEGHYEPVACVINIGEAREIAQSDMRRRLRALQRDQDPGLCPYCYKVWARGIAGDHRIAATLAATSI